MSDYDEKRDFPRMRLNCEAEFTDRKTGERFATMVINLSGGGVLFRCERMLAVGEPLTMEVHAGTADRPPLRAQIKVIRVEDRGEGGCQAAAVIERILDAEQGPS